MRIGKWVALALSFGVLPFVGGMSSSQKDVHLYLEASIPGEDTVVTSLPEITLWFSQQPWPNTTEIRVYDVDAKKRMDVRAVYGYDDDPFTYSAMLAAPLPPGHYLVWWRTKSDDGEPAPLIGGDIPFVVKAP
jgi:methionine-rich copper-binding protein CopC